MIESRDLPPLPEGWVWTTLEDLSLNPKQDVVDGPFGSNLKASEYKEEGIPIIRLQNIDRNKFIRKNIKYISSEKAQRLSRHSFEKGNIVITKLGDPLGKACIVPDYMDWGIIVADVVRINLPGRFILIDFMPYLLNSEIVAEQLERKTKGTTRPRVNLSHIRELLLPLPPLPEQHRIVSKIEELFTKLDSGVDELKKIKAQLKRYRQSVLKNAFEGRLTEEWRAKHKNELEPASILIERIKEERKKKLKGKYKELPPVDTSELPELPEGWVWTNFEHIAENTPHALKAGPFGSALKKEYYAPKGYKIYGQEQVIRDDPFYGDYYIDEERYEMLKSCGIKTGDVLISLVGTIGRVLILPEGIEPGIINPRLAKISLDKRLIYPNYIKVYLQSSIVKHYFSLSSHGGTMDILNLSILKRLPIPLPPLKEQKTLLDEFEEVFSIINEIEKTADINIKIAERLRQSILKRAFEGKLVPQDPTDEPASVLLERIKAERETRKKEVKLKLTKTKRKRDLVQVQKQTRFNEYV